MILVTSFDTTVKKKKKKRHTKKGNFFSTNISSGRKFSTQHKHAHDHDGPERERLPLCICEHTARASDPISNCLTMTTVAVTVVTTHYQSTFCKETEEADTTKNSHSSIVWTIFEIN